MLVKVRKGAIDAPEGSGDDDELWSGGHEGLSAAALATAGTSLEVGTWYDVDDFERLLVQISGGASGEVRGAITVDQPGVDRSWSASIEVDETDAALMLCRSVVQHARLVGGNAGLWVRVE